MTNTIGSLSSGHAASQAAAQGAQGAPSKPATPEPAAPAGAAQAGEAVTLSATSQAGAQLLAAARAADGVDEARVAQLRGAVQAGTYEVAPEDLAKAIIGGAIGNTSPGASGNGTT